MRHNSRTPDHAEPIPRPRRRSTRFALLPALAALALCTAAPAQDSLKPRDAVIDASTALDSITLIIHDFIEALMQLQTIESRAEEIEFDEAEIFFEENATDGDLGIQFFLDGDEWDHVVIVDPGGHRMVDVKVRGNTRVIGLTEIFSESAEPDFDEMPRDEFLALFDEGVYMFFGRTLDGDVLVGSATLTKTMPDQPEITLPEEDDEVDANAPLVIEWNTVPDPDAPDSVIVAYQIVVEKDEDDERLRVYSVDMLPTDTSVTVAPGFLEPGKDYKVELIVVETSGNKTITEVPFTTAK